jgi:glycine/D-amino acid oxidase-like deaminating enzyme
MCYLFDHGVFLAPLHHEGRWLLSFTSHDWDCPPEASRLTVSEVDRRAGLAMLERYFPALTPACSGARVFCDAYTTDGIPLIARVPGPGDFVVAGGASGVGIRLGPGIGVRAVEALSSREGDAT